MGKKRKAVDGAEAKAAAPAEPPKKQPKKSEKSSKESADREKLQALVNAFSTEQTERYEFYRRSAFPKAAVKRLMQTVAGVTVPPNAVIAMAGMAKVFVGEIVEEALDIREKSESRGPVEPRHLREAMRRLKNRGAMPSTRFEKKPFG
ncbi:transcription initiation factor TFIID subunit 11-like [Oscarella lobularis]|uniref:transcription initiation factor TFIID subunit 11-like n=1 Tax=Oscarella lobularis TaxID=121494 RepID=UPI0033136463